MARVRKWRKGVLGGGSMLVKDIDTVRCEKTFCSCISLRMILKLYSLFFQSFMATSR